MRRPEFRFQFPPIQGVFDMHGTIYVFGECHESDIADIINHETLHSAIKRVAGRRASLKFDKINKEVEK